jgi:hypothetical protein
MDAKTIEMVDRVVEGYNKVKSLFQENAEMFRNIKKWVKDHKVIIFVVLIVLVAIAYFIYRQYQLNKQNPVSDKQKTRSFKGKSGFVKDPPLGDLIPDPDELDIDPENPDLIPST